MTEVVSTLLKINLRMRTRENVAHLLCDVLGGTVADERGSDTIGDFQASTFSVGGVLFDVVVPDSDDAPLARVIDKHGEGIDSICYAVEDMDNTQQALREQGLEFSRQAEFHGNKVAFVHPRDACGIGLEFIQGPLVEGPDPTD